jgi:hypothetical protein
MAWTRVSRLEKHMFPGTVIDTEENMIYSFFARVERGDPLHAKTIIRELNVAWKKERKVLSAGHKRPPSLEAQYKTFVEKYRSGAPDHRKYGPDNNEGGELRRPTGNSNTDQHEMPLTDNPATEEDEPEVSK